VLNISLKIKYLIYLYMHILGQKSIGPISNIYGKKMKPGLNSFGNKLVNMGTRKAHHHIEEQIKKHYSPLEKR